MQTYGERAAARQSLVGEAAQEVPGQGERPAGFPLYLAHFYSLFIMVLMLIAWYPGIGQIRLYLTMAVVAVWSVGFVLWGPPPRWSGFLVLYPP